MRSAADVAVMSTCRAVPPIWLATADSRSPWAGRSAQTTRAPSRARTPAIAAPMPCAAPVTTATRPSNGRSQSVASVVLLGCAATRTTWPLTNADRPDRKKRSVDSRASSAPSSTSTRLAVAPARTSFAAERTIPSSACRTAACSRVLGCQWRPAEQQQPAAGIEPLEGGGQARVQLGQVGDRLDAGRVGDDRGEPARPVVHAVQLDACRVEDPRDDLAELAGGGSRQQGRAGQERVAWLCSGAARPGGAARAGR